MIYSILGILGFVFVLTIILVYLSIYYLTYVARKKYSRDFWVKKPNRNGCHHTSVETHFSDVFGCYYVCRLCEKDVTDFVNYGCDNENICSPESLFDTLEKCSGCGKIL